MNQAKRHWLKLVTILLVACTLFGMWWHFGKNTPVQQYVAQVDSRQPKLVCPRVVNLGTRQQGEVVDANFEVENAGNVPLTLNGFRFSCSCLGFVADQGKGDEKISSITLEPGSVHNLRFRLAVGKRKAEGFLTNAIFLTNDPANSEFEIRFHAPIVRGGLDTNPKVIQFGITTVSENHKTLDFELVDWSGSRRQVVRLVSSNPAVRVSFSDSQPDTEC
jgi:hypothetical protein